MVPQASNKAQYLKYTTRGLGELLQEAHLKGIGTVRTLKFASPEAV